MCWKTCKAPIKQIAESDLKVYKILKRVENYIVSPINGFIWELNKTYKTELDNPYCYIYEDIDGWNIINRGFHSLLDSPKLHIIVFFGRIWCTKSCDVMCYSPNEYVFEAVIPKGSEYYENENGEIVSNQLKIINNIMIMTRIEEITKFARNYVNDNFKGDSYEAYAEQEDIIESCISAATWADNNPNPEYKEKIVNEVCDWLKNHINDYLVKGRDIDYIFDDLHKSISKKN